MQMIKEVKTMKKVTRNKILKTLAVVVLPGGIPIFLGYKAYQLYKRYDREKKGRDGEGPEAEDNRQHKI